MLGSDDLRNQNGKLPAFDRFSQRGQGRSANRRIRVIEGLDQSARRVDSPLSDKSDQNAEGFSFGFQQARGYLGIHFFARQAGQGRLGRLR